MYIIVLYKYKEREFYFSNWIANKFNQIAVTINIIIDEKNI